MSDATTNLTIGCVAVLGIGSVVTEEIPNMKVILAGGVVVISLSVLNNIEPKLSTGFATIIFIALCAKYLPDTIERLGFRGGASGADIQPQKIEAKKEKTAPPAPGVQPATAFVPTTPAGGNPTTATPQNSSGGRVYTI